MLTHNQTVDLLKLISQYYSDFEITMEKVKAWHEILQEFNFDMLKEAVFDKLKNKHGYSEIKVFDLIHFCRNKLATEKIIKLNQLNKIISDDNNFLEKQLMSLHCDFAAKKNYLDNSYYEPMTMDFVKNYEGDFFNELNYSWYKLSQSDILKKFYYFAKFDIKHKPIREEINKLNSVKFLNND